MAFRNIAQIGRAIEEEGSFQYSYFFKPNIPQPGSVLRIIDASVASGVPKYNGYVGAQLTSTQLFGEGNAGVYCGSVPEGKERHLLTWSVGTTTATAPMALMLCDYLMFYPLIDLEDTDPQVMTNSVGLPRYTDGEGVRMALVCSVPATVASTGTVEYVNQDGNVSTVSFSTLTGNPGMVLSAASTATQSNYFMPLASGDSGVRRVNSFQMSSAAGGFATIVLVKPIATLPIYETSTISEATLINDKLIFPKIYDGAYLNFFTYNTFDGASTLRGEMVFVTR